MAKMKAVQVPKAGGDFEVVEREIPQPGPGHVRIRVQACGVCHSDVLTKEGGWPGLTYPRVPGHDAGRRRAGAPRDSVCAEIRVPRRGDRARSGERGPGEKAGRAYLHRQRRNRCRSRATEIERRARDCRYRAKLESDVCTCRRLGSERQVGGGRDDGSIEVTPVQLIVNMRSLQGWASGLPTDSEDTLRFAEMTGVRPMIEKYPLAQAAEAYARMMSGKAEFRVVLTM